jgi:hypothetical protein
MTSSRGMGCAHETTMERFVFSPAYLTAPPVSPLTM